MYSNIVVLAFKDNTTNLNTQMMNEIHDFTRDQKTIHFLEEGTGKAL